MTVGAVLADSVGGAESGRSVAASRSVGEVPAGAAPGQGQGDRSALDALARAYRVSGAREDFDAFARELLPLARRFVASRFPFEAEARDDALQDALVRLVRATRKWRGGSIEGFVCAVLHRACADARRAFARDRALAGRALRFLRDAGEEPGPDQALAASVEAEAALRALDSLDERTRTAIYLKDAEGLSLADTASAIGAGEGTTKSLLSRGRAKVRAMLEEAGYGR